MYRQNIYKYTVHEYHDKGKKSEFLAYESKTYIDRNSVNNKVDWSIGNIKSKVLGCYSNNNDRKALCSTRIQTSRINKRKDIHRHYKSRNYYDDQTNQILFKCKYNFLLSL